MKPRGEIVLLYNIPDEKSRKLRMLMVRMGMRFKVVDPSDYGQPIGLLAGIKEAVLENPEAEVQTFDDEMMIMRGFTSSRLDLFLQNMRKAGIEKIDYKAIVTPTNMRWNSWQLYLEIKQEHEEMHAMDK